MKFTENISIDRDYFEVLDILPDQIVIKSKCTGHTWQIIFRGERYIDIYHKHNDRSSFHWHQSVLTFSDAVDEIKGHDEFQLNGRRPTYLVYARDGIYRNGRLKKY